MGLALKVAPSEPLRVHPRTDHPQRHVVGDCLAACVCVVSGRGVVSVARRTKLAVLARDNHVCVIAGLNCVGVATVVDHRANRGAGGSVVLDSPENLISACPLCNGGKEDADGAYRAELVARGIRVPKRATNAQTATLATTTPVLYADGWYRLEGFLRTPINANEAVEYMTDVGAITTGKGWAY